MGDPPPVPPPAQRPSGLRPPSNIPGRIARPSGLPRPPPTPVTPHHPPTPLTPAAPTPRASGVAAQKQQEARIRKINEEVSRMKLADVEEEDLETPSYYDRSRRDSEVSRRSSLGNGSRRGSEVDRKKRVSDALPSAEALWESARRLSEAGVRRCSDASVILTEDTDSFIIGDKVWVGGTKPGQIAYIGETQFAPGEWAGVVLDETIGKNDGSVAGVRYFQCEAKRGVFSRLTRLTRTPLATLGEQDGEPTSPVSRRPSSALSHTGSLRGENKLSPSPTPHDMSNSIGLHSPSQPEPRVGERVIVMSSQGSKAGVLRYIGTTEFAAGMWAGVELDDPVGKNDGSVGDKRYFECMPKYGLFAPVAKVSRSPSSGAGMRRGVCSVHHTNPNSTSTSSLRRRGSRESIASTTGSTSSAVRSPAPRVRLGVNSLGQKPSTRTTPTAATMQTTLQNTLRDKEQYIEQLLKERELERAEVTRAASQVDDAEQKLSNLKLEFEQYQEQMQAQLQDAQLMLSGIELDKRELATQLEEERRRVEDLQFRFEEASIAKIDMEKRRLERQGQDEVHLERIKELEKALQDERKRAEELELESNRAFEMEENLAKVREEAEQELRVKIEELGTQLAQKETILGEKEQALQAQEKEMTVLKSEVEGLKKKSIAQEEGEKSHSVDLETMKQENAQLVQRIQAAEDKFNQVLKEKQLMEEKVNELQALNTEKVKSESEISTRLVKETERIAELESQLRIASEEVKGATEKYSSYLSESKKDIEELKKAKDEEISSLKQSLQKEAEAALKLKQEEVDKMSQMCSEIKAESQKDLEELKNRKDSEIEGLRMSLTKNGDEALKAKQEELDKMSQMFSDLKAESKKEMEELKTRKDAEIEGLKQSLVKHGDEALKAKQEELDKMSQMYSNLIDASKKEIEDLRAQKDLEMDELKKSLLKQKEEALLSKEEELEKVRQSSLDFTSEARKEIENLKKERDAELESVRQSLIKQSEESLKVKQEEVDRIHEELNNYKIQSSKETELLLSQKNSEIEDLKQSLLKEGDEALKAKQQEVENLKQEISSLQAEKTSTVEELEKAHKAELETLRTSCQSKDDEISRLKSELESLMSNVEGQKSVTEEAVSVMRNKMEEVCVLKDNLMKEKEEMIPRLTQLQGEVVTLKEEKMKMDETLLKTQSWLETMTSQMSQLLSVIGGNVNVESPVPSDESKDAKTSDPEKMAARLKSVGSMIQSCAELGVKMKGVMEELEETKKREAEMISSFQSEKESLEQMAQSLKSLLEKQEKDIQERQQEINQLNAEKSQANKYKTLLEGLEREKTQLERKVVELQVAVAQSKANANNEDSTYQNLMAEKEMAQGQIDFLNSVIVDMQRKNDDLKARVEILEIGITPADADELNLNGIKPRMVAPRLFCDICDVFDLHDTEDCPRQASDSPPPLIKHHRAVTPDGSKSKRIVPDRPYCDTCEVFGHDTADCEDGETF